MQITFEDLIHN